MRFIILAYHPHFIRSEAAEAMAMMIKTSESCNVYLLRHTDKDSDPIYCVKFANVEEK